MSFEVRSDGKRSGGGKPPTRIAFRRQTPSPVDFDDIEEEIIGSVRTRKKDFATARGAGSGRGKAAASPGSVPGNRKTQRSVPSQPGALSPLQGLQDLQKGEEEEHKSFQSHKHYGVVYGAHGETPIAWARRNLAKANAAVGAAVGALRTTLAAGSGGKT